MGLDIYFHLNKKGQEETSEIGYYRKVNFLVSFFEDYGEVKNLKPLKIEKSWVKDLIDCCDEVLKDNSKADELLPTTSGFFFGSTEYDEKYFYDVEKVKNFCENFLIEEFENLEDDEYITFEIWY